jgi:hypothetical protein
MSRMAIFVLGLALVATTGCENLMSSGSDKALEDQSGTSGGAASGSPGRHGPATGSPRTSSSDKSSPGDLTRQGKIPGEDMLN